MRKYQKILIGLLIVLSLGIYGDKSFKDNRFKEIEEVKAQTIQDIEDYQKKDRVIPLTKKQEKELAKAKKEKEIALEKEKVKKVNDDFGKSLDNIEGKINNLDFNYENPYDKLSKEDQDRLSKENKDRLNKLTEKAKKDQEGLAKLRKEPSQKDNTDYQNAALNKIRDNNNKKVETKIRQEEEKRKKEEQKKKEQAAKQKATTSGQSVSKKENPPQAHPYSFIINGQVWNIVEGGQGEIDQRYSNTWVNMTGIWGDHYAIYNNNDDQGMFLGAHREIGHIIENVKSLTYVDPNGTASEYRYIGVTDYIQGGYSPMVYYDEDGNYDGSDVSYMPYCMGIAGKYIVFQTCIDYSGRSIALGWVFEKVN